MAFGFFNKSPEKKELEDLSGELSRTRYEITKAKVELTEVLRELNEQKALLIQTNEQVLLQEFGLYDPVYDFATSDQYKDRLADVRNLQKDLVKSGGAATGSTNWTVNGNKSQGKKMVSDMQKLLLRAFNSECDEAISKVKFNTVDTAKKRIQTSRDAISKLGAIMGVSITNAYFKAKMDELQLAYEYQVKKQEEKEEQKRIREELREQAKLQKEIEETRKEIEKEKKHYSNALSKLEQQIAKADESEKEALDQKKAEIMDQLGKLDVAMKDVDYRAANHKAGYVYVISNIGAFGEDVYKIGMTRRLDPMERIDELGDASVPFNFDVHAMIFADDAPGLENALHHAFEDKKVNMVNTRREFFRVTLEEIETVVKANYDKTVEFVRVPEADQYRQSLAMRKLVAKIPKWCDGPGCNHHGPNYEICKDCVWFLKEEWDKRIGTH